MTNTMKKSELVNHVEELNAYIADLEETLVYVRERKPAVVTETVEVKKSGRKDEVLAILKQHGHVSVGFIARTVGINERNVSSQLTYLRRDGYRIATDSRVSSSSSNINLAGTKVPATTQRLIWLRPRKR